MKTVSIKINGKKIAASANSSILQVAKDNNIDIPTLCNHPDLPPRASCRLCLVQIKGEKRPVTSCDTIVQEGMEIKTQTAELKVLRNINLQLIFGEHATRCAKCIRSTNCTILDLAKDFDIDIQHFPLRKKQPHLINYGQVMYLEDDKCIECGNCVAACRQQGTNCLLIENQGTDTHISLVKDNPCIACGQCSVHCPVGAIHAQNHIDKVEQALSNKKKTVVFQFAPSIRVSIGEEFGLPPGSIVTGQLIAALKRLGADWITDVANGADFTTFAEAKELVERVKEKKRLPMFTSCCPAWVNYLETRFQRYLPNLTTVRSPHIISGGLTKHVFARRGKLDPYDVFVVSIMPCTSKKAEIMRPQLNYKGFKPVDAVLTTRELAYMIKQHNINLASLPSQEADSLLGEETGSGSIYGASGGVMEAALRTAHFLITGKDMTNLHLRPVRGLKEVKEAQLTIGKYSLKVAVANGMSGAIEILQKLSANPHQYDYIEVMACPGGCIGGGGQPVSLDNDIRRKRQEALYSIDERNAIRYAHHNPLVEDVVNAELKSPSFWKGIIDTNYHERLSPLVRQVRVK